jgi:hypothetical protein
MRILKKPAKKNKATLLPDAEFWAAGLKNGPVKLLLHWKSAA